MNRRLKNKTANIKFDEKCLKEFPYVNRKIKVNETDKIIRREAIIYKLLNRYHQTMINGMLNTIEFLIHIILKRKTKKNYCDNEENKKKRMR